MLRRILVPLDGSGLAARALTYATALGVRTGAELVLLRAAYSHTMPGVDARERQQGAIDEAQAYIDRITAQVAATSGRSVQGVVRYGHPAECITESARTRQVDLIVMATHGRTGPDHLIFGSVAEGVVATSPVPVLIQRAWQPLFGQPLAEYPKIIVPLDGSAFAESALAPAARLAEDLGGHLVLLSMQDDPVSIRTAAEYLSTLQTRLQMDFSRVPTMVEVRTGNPAQGIVTAVDVLEADLVFMATHGRTGPRRAVLGSVAGKLLQDGDAPVILVRPERVDTTDELPTTAHATVGTPGA